MKDVVRDGYELVKVNCDNEDCFCKKTPVYAAVPYIVCKPPVETPKYQIHNLQDFELILKDIADKLGFIANVTYTIKNAE
jgi:hypothetical protein